MMERVLLPALAEALAWVSPDAYVSELERMRATNITRLHSELSSI